MKFPYRRYEIFYKPVVPVVFKFKDKSFPYQALIDTGADISIIHAEIAEQLGLKLESGEKFSFAGICGEATGFLHHIDLEIGGHVFKDVPVIFTKDINSYGFGILGHERLFSKMKLTFELAKKEIEIIPKDF
jgi:predicted aspartyl protease